MVYLAIAGGLALTVIALLIAFRFLKPGNANPHAAPIDTNSNKQPPANQRFLNKENVLRIAGPFIAVLPIVVGLIQFATSQRERAEDETRAEYIRATQLLTESGPARPMSGIAALTQLAENSIERTWLMTESISAFVRYTSPRSDAATRHKELSPEGPYNDPPCKTVLHPDERFDYSACATFSSLYLKNSAVQAALEALGNRNPENETRKNVPRRFKSQLETTNNFNPDGDAKQRALVLGIIDDGWFGKHSKASNNELILEMQYPILQAYPGTLRRPWLNLSHTSLVGLELTAPFLEGGVFRGSDLSFSKLPGAMLAKADLTSSWLVGTAMFEADLRGATLEYADARGADLTRAQFQKAWMSGGIFFRAAFWEADLSDAYLIASNMRDLKTMVGARLDRIVAFRADFSKATIGGDGSEVVCARDAFLKEALFVGANLQGVDFQNSQMQAADFSGANMRGADLRGTILDGARLDGADLSGADLRGVDLSKIIGTPMHVDRAVVDDLKAIQTRWPALNAQQVVVRPQTPRAAGMCETTKRTDSERAVLSIHSDW